MKEIAVTDKEAGQRLDKFLKKYFGNATPSLLFKQMRKKNITLNRKKVEGKELVSPGDRIQVFFSDETFENLKTPGVEFNKFGKFKQEIPKEYHEIKVLFEDEDYLIINKVCGILTESDGSGAPSINDYLLWYLKGKGEKIDTKLYKPSACNRLDRNTSGIVLCAKTYAGARVLSDAIANHSFRKIYLAVAEGNGISEATLTGYHHKDKKENLVQILDTPLNDGDSLVETKILPLEEKDGYSLMEVELVTGKSHQIRAHFASIGHPLAGDKKYGGKAYLGRKMQALHAAKVVFPADEQLGELSGKTIKCPIPSYFGEWNYKL